MGSLGTRLAGAKESRKPARAASKALLAPLGRPHPWLQSKTPKEGFPKKLIPFGFKMLWGKS